MTARNPDHYAIVVGIDTYGKLGRLRGAVADATRFMQWLLKEDGGGLDSGNIQPVLSAPTMAADVLDAIPKQTDITKALRALGVERNERLGKRLYFYFAGHGFGPGFDNVGMLLADAYEPTHLGSNVGLREYRYFFRQHLLFDEVVFILDCCRDERQAPTRGPDFDLAVNGAGSKFTDYVVLAAIYGEKAWQPVDSQTGERRGLLTKAVLEGLEGAAADGLGRVTYITLGDYVKARVPKLAEELRTDVQVGQTPQIDALATNVGLVLATIPADRLDRVRVRIVAPATLAGNLLLCEGVDRREIDRRPAAQATAATPWEVSLVRNRVYEVKSDAKGISQSLDTSALQPDQVFQFLGGI